MARIESKILIKDLKSRTQYCISEAKKWKKLNEHDLNLKRDLSSWSIGQCLDHLILFGNYYIPLFNESIKNSNKPTSTYFIPGFIGNMYAKAMLPNQVKLGASSDKSPSTIRLTNEIVDQFIVQQKQYLELLELAEKVNLNTNKVSTSISKWVSLKLGDALRVAIFHNERHIRQALQVFKKK